MARYIGVKHFTLGLFALSLLGGPAVAQDVNGIAASNPQGDYTQKATGMVFPVSVGPFSRVAVSQYAADGSDESASYIRNVPVQEITATVYVFPSPNIDVMSWPKNEIAQTRAKLCASRFDAVKSEVTSVRPDAVLKSEKKETFTQDGRNYTGHKAIYTLTARQFLDRKNVAIRSEAYLFCYVGGKWAVEYRVVYPAEYDASGPVAAFMRDLRWTIPPEAGN